MHSFFVAFHFCRLYIHDSTQIKSLETFFYFGAVSIRSLISLSSGFLLVSRLLRCTPLTPSSRRIRQPVNIASVTIIHHNLL